ncbi:MAG TPA: MFS transporter [Polyangia bacterium]|nr:MFS transporter [Polyangia bacterium]
MIEAFYFFLFQAVAVNMGFMPSHLRALGLSGRQISAALAAAPVLAMVAPLGWAWLADRTQRHNRVLQVISFGAFAGFAPLALATGPAAGRFSLVMGAYLTYAAFFVAMGGMVDALAVARVRAGAIYGRIRQWGSIGYVLGALGVGGALALTGAPVSGRLPPMAVWLALGGAFLASLSVTGTGERAARPRLTDVHTLLASPELRLTLLAGALHWMCMSPYNVFLGVFLRDQGLGPLATGSAYAIGVTAEALVLLHFHRLHARFRIDTLLAVAFAASGVRWLGTALAHAPAALILLQIGHGMTFGMFWSAAIALVAATVPPSLRATGQALLVIAINLGAALGNLGTGVLYDALGPRAVFALAAAGELLPLLVILQARRLTAGAFAQRVPSP